MSVRAEKVPAWKALQDVKEGRANLVPDQVRLEQAKAIVAYWPWDFLERWIVTQRQASERAWAVLEEPTHWHDVDKAKVIAWVTAEIELRAGKRGWDGMIGDLRVAFGRRHNHPPDDPDGPPSGPLFDV